MSINGGHTPWVVVTGSGYSAAAPAEAYILITPKHGGNGKIVIWHHGTGGETVFVLPGWATAATPSTANVRTNLHNNILTPLVDEGYSILSCDFGGQATFGDDKNLARITDGYNWAVANGFHNKIGLIGESMGSGSVIQWTSQNTTKVSAVLTYMTASDYDDVYYNVAGFNTKMDTAYSAPNTPTGGWLANSADRNPSSPTVYGAIKSAGLGRHWLAYYASDDPIANPSKVVAFASLMGQPSRAIDLGTGGHTDDPLVNVNPVDVATLFNGGAW